MSLRERRLTISSGLAGRQQKLTRSFYHCGNGFLACEQPDSTATPVPNRVEEVLRTNCISQVRSKIILHLNSNSSGISRSHITVSGYILEFKDKKEKAREENTILKHAGGHLYLDIIYTQGVLKI